MYILGMEVNQSIYLYNHEYSIGSYSIRYNKNAPVASVVNLKDNSALPTLPLPQTLTLIVLLPHTPWYKNYPQAHHHSQPNPTISTICTCPSLSHSLMKSKPLWKTHRHWCPYQCLVPVPTTCLINEEKSK